jgi:hypothetical protein
MLWCRTHLRYLPFAAFARRVSQIPLLIDKLTGLNTSNAFLTHNSKRLSVKNFCTCYPHCINSVFTILASKFTLKPITGQACKRVDKKVLSKNEL